MAVIEALTEEECYLVSILQDESGLDQAEFLFHNAEEADGCWRAWAFQWSWFRCTDPLQIDQSGRSIGKALDTSTVVPTPTGWTTMGEIEAGDLVFGDDGQPVRVAEAFDVLEGRPCFEVVFDDGATIVADRDHLWATWNRVEASRKRKGGCGSTKVRSTWEIQATLHYGKEANHRVDVAQPLAIDEVELPLSPYVLGYWLGDGSSDSCGVTIGPQDRDEAVDLLQAEGVVVEKWSSVFGYGLRWPDEWVKLASLGGVRPRSILDEEEIRDLREWAYCGADGVGLSRVFDLNVGSVSRLVTGDASPQVGGWVRSKRVPLGRTLVDLGVIRNKHIPDRYLWASVSQRLRLLQGLMDSDGHITKIGRCEITQKSEILARQIYGLVASLGEKPFWEKRSARCNGVDAGPVYRVGWAPSQWVPFRFARKKARLRLPANPSRTAQRRIVDVRPVESRAVRCIAVENESKLFLVGETMVPTHNSQSISLRAFAFPFLHPGQEMVVTAPEKVHLDAITDKIETQLLATRLTREMLIGGRSGFKHTPFHCIAEGQMVLTDRGHQPIEQVRPGDQVLSHTGSWRKVEAVLDQGVQEVVVASGRGHPGLLVTRDHEFWTRAGRWSPTGQGATAEKWFDPPRWVSPDHWDHGRLNVKRVPLDTHWASPSEVTGCEPVPPSLIQHRRGRMDVVVDPSDLALLWLLGLYTAEGCTTTGNVVLTVHMDEVAEVSNRIDKTGLAYRIVSQDRVGRPSKARDFWIAGKAFAAFIRRHFPGHANQKGIPPWIWSLDQDQRREYFDGYAFGDGHWTEAGAVRLVTSSKRLACDMKILAQTIGFNAGLYSRPPSKSSLSGHPIDGGPCWEVYVDLTPGVRKHKHDTRDGKHQWSRTSPVSLDSPIFAQTYDLVVADDHSFVCEGIVVHNCNFSNGSRIMGRIPQRDGKGIKGVHPIWLELDEAQDYPSAGWTEIVETLKRGSTGAVWRAHGVTRGVRDDFYKFTQPSSGWSVHRHTAMARPNWTDEERQEKITSYGGSKDHPDYRRNVLGLHGDATAPLFVLHRLMAVVDDDETSEYNQDEYYSVRINDEMYRDFGGDIAGMLNFPGSHKGKQYLYRWVGMDVGYTVAPSEILIFGEMKALKGKESVLKLLTRIHLERVGHNPQVEVIEAVIESYRPKTFAMDSTGIGLPLYQDLQERDTEMARYIRGYNFSSQILVGFDNTIDVDEYTGDPVKEAGIKRNVLEHAQDTLRDYVDNGRLLLPWDRNLIGQFQGGTSSARAGHDQYGRKRIFSQGEDHALDASRMAVLGHSQYHIEEMMKKDRQEPVFDIFLA